MHCFNFVYQLSEFQTKHTSQKRFTATAKLLPFVGSTGITILLGGPTKCFLKGCLINDKTVDISEFVNIQRAISAINCSITILFRCRH